MDLTSDFSGRLQTSHQIIKDNRATGMTWLAAALDMVLFITRSSASSPCRCVGEADHVLLFEPDHRNNHFFDRRWRSGLLCGRNCLLSGSRGHI